MNYNTDRPIEKREYDKLGRVFFSEKLGETIYKYNSTDGLVIGLFGKWGTGKTSIINMTEEKLLELYKKKSKNDNERPLIMRFSPWNYSDKNDLIRIFFQNLKSKINLQESGNFRKKVGKALHDYAALVDLLALVPATIGGTPILSTGATKMLRDLVKSRGANMMKEADLESTRETLEKELINAGKKIIIVIDDVDRLTNNQIRDVFQLVKQVADFPNVIYVLSMDREVVSRALKKIHDVDGNEYLEKIIQIPFEIPELNKNKLNDIFFDKLNKILEELEIDFKGSEYWNSVFYNCISPYVNTLRDVNRLINVFQFRYAAVCRETAFEDMLAITTIEVLEPKLYKWVIDNKDVVCKNVNININKETKLSNRRLYLDEFKELGIENDKALKCISTLFPAFKNRVDEYGYNYHINSTARGNMRVSHEEKFELYFGFDLSDIKVSRSLINACINLFDKKELSIAIKEIYTKGNIIYFIEEMQGLVDKVPYNRLELISSVLLELQGEFIGDDNRGMFARGINERVTHLAKEIVKKLNTEEERYNVISLAISDAHKNELGMLAYIINGIELAYARLAGQTSDSDGQIINLEQLEKLEKEYVEKIRNIAESESILEIPNFRMAFYIWESFDKDGATSYINKLFENTVNKLKFMSANSGKWIGTRGSGWDYDAKSYVEYITKEELYDIVDNIDKDTLFELSELEQIKVASFYLNYNKNENDDRVNEETALELVNKWELEK